MPASQSKKELIENSKKGRVKMENGITYEYSLVEKIEFHGSRIMLKLKRKLDCFGTDHLWFKSVSPERKEEVKNYSHAILVSYKYFEDKNFSPYFEHDFEECIDKRVIVWQSKARFERMLEEIKEEIGPDPAILALIETANEIVGHIGHIFK